jgi:hypothetical protein
MAGKGVPEGAEMKTKYKFIYFEEVRSDLFQDEKKSFKMKNNRSKKTLGTIDWYEPWKRYCFIPSDLAVFDDSCLSDIIHFIGQLK